MALRHLLFLVILSLVSSSLQDVTDNKVDSQEESPLADVAKEILKEKNLENIGGMVNSFIQSGGAKQLMDGVLQNLGNGENSGQLLESLGNLLGSGGNEEVKSERKAKKGGNKANGEVNPMELLSGIGSLVGALQGAGAGGGGDGGANPAALLQGLGSLIGGGNNQGAGAAALLQGLGSLLGSSSKEEESKRGGDNNAADLLQGLGSMIGAAVGNQNGGDNNAGALLQGLGSLLGGGQGNQGGINPEMIGNMINMFSNLQGDEEKEQKPPTKKAHKKATSEKIKAKKNPNTKPQKGSKAGKGKGSLKGLDGVLSLAKSFLGRGKGKGGNSENIDLSFLYNNLPLLLKMAKYFGGLQPNTDKSQTKDDSFDLGNIINLATTLFSQAGSKTNKGSGESSFMDYLPMIISTLNSFTGPEAQKRADSHSEHSWTLPPVLERIHVYYDNFINSDMGKSLFSYMGEQQAFKAFQDKDGNFSYDKFEELIENHSFRRHWIKQVSEKLVAFLQVVSDKKTYNQYVEMGIAFTNSFLQKSGFPKKALFDTKKPAKSLTNFANYAAKKYLEYDVDTREYVEPVVSYVQDLLKMAHKSISPGTKPKELTEKLTDTINMEIIEPITRVNRAFRFAKSQPSCDRYVFCLINQQVPNNSESLPGFKKVLYKGSSLIAAWFVSSSSGTSYWDLYGVITENTNCMIFHNDACKGFHEEEIKATTEYVHNEL